MSTVSRVTIISRSCTWGHTSTFSSVINFSDQVLGVSNTVSGSPNFPTLHLGSHIHGLRVKPSPCPAPEGTCPQSQGDPTSQSCTWGHCHSLWVRTLPESTRGSHVHSPQVIPTPRPCTWGHMSSPQGDSSSPDLVPEVSVHSFQGQHTLHTPYICGHTFTVSMVTPPPLLYLDYITTVYRVKHLSGPCTWNHTSRISRVNHFQNLHLEYLCRVQADTPL